MSCPLCGGQEGWGKEQKFCLGIRKDAEMEQKAPYTLDLHQGNRMPFGVCVPWGTEKKKKPEKSEYTASLKGSVHFYHLLPECQLQPRSKAVCGVSLHFKNEFQNVPFPTSFFSSLSLKFAQFIVCIPQVWPICSLDKEQTCYVLETNLEDLCLQYWHC